jgi:hypothetical protein
MRLSHVLRLTVPATVRTSHGSTSEEILRTFGKAPSAAAHEAPKVETTQGLDVADARPSIVPLRSCLLASGF